MNKYLAIQRAHLKKTQRRFSPAFEKIPAPEWEKLPVDIMPREVWRNNRFLVMLYEESNNILRLSILRTELRADGHWRDGIAWEELQAIKRGIGHGETFAVEIFPKDTDAITAANIRHLWLLPEPLPFGWRRDT